MKDKIKEFIAKLLYFIGIKPCYSTGICGSSTCGYGKLDRNGYWEYPLYLKEDINNDR